LENIKGFESGVFYEGAGIDKFLDKEKRIEIIKNRLGEIGEMKTLIYKPKSNGLNGLSETSKTKTKIFSKEEVTMENLKLLLKDKEISTSGKMVVSLYYWPKINQVISSSKTPTPKEFINGVNKFIGEELFKVKAASTPIRRYSEDMKIKRVKSRMIIPEYSEEFKKEFYKTLKRCYKTSKVEHFLDIKDEMEIIEKEQKTKNIRFKENELQHDSNNIVDSVITKFVRHLGISEIVITEKEIRILFNK